MRGLVSTPFPIPDELSHPKLAEVSFSLDIELFLDALGSQGPCRRHAVLWFRFCQFDSSVERPLEDALHESTSGNKLGGSLELNSFFLPKQWGACEIRAHALKPSDYKGSGGRRIIPG